MSELKDYEFGYCVNCGAPIHPDSVFCDACGWKHGDILPDQITEDDIRRWNNMPELSEKKEKRAESNRRLKVFVRVVLGTTGLLIAAILAVFFFVIKPVILDKTEDMMQQEVSEGELSEALKQNTQDPPVVTPTPTPTATPETTPTPTPTPTAIVTPVVVTHQFVDLSVIDGTRYPRFSINNTASMTSSSEYHQNNVKNNASLVFDGDDKTSWQEGVDGDGIGQYIDCKLNREYVIRYFAFKLGNWRSDKYYNGNGRPKSVTVTADDYTFTFDFPEEKKEYVIELSEEIKAANVRVTIDSVYKGAYWDDTCITQFHMYGY